MSERPRQHAALGCLIWGSLLLMAVVLLLILAYHWWMHDTSDLERAAAHARAQGLVIDPERYYPALASEERIAAWERVVRLVEDDPVLAEAGYPPEPVDWDAEQFGEWEVDLPAIGQPVSASWQYWVTEQVGYERYDALLDAILAIELGPLHRKHAIGLSPFADYLASRQRVMQALIPLSLVAESEVRQQRVNEAMARVVGFGARGMLAIDLLVQISLQSLGLHGFLNNGLDDQEAFILESWLSEHQAETQLAINGEWLWQYDIYRQLPILGDEFYNGNILNPPFYERLLWQPALRKDREVLLERLAEFHQMLTWPPGRALRHAQDQDATISRHAQGWLSWWYLGEGILSLAHYNMLKAYHQHRLHLQLVLADHRQQPWPEDPWNAGTTLRPIRSQDGTVVGAYSVGEDGSDDGWQAEDWVFWLTEELDP